MVFGLSCVSQYIEKCLVAVFGLFQQFYFYGMHCLSVGCLHISSYMEYLSCACFLTEFSLFK